MRSPEELQQERIDEIQKEKHLRNEIERLTDLPTMWLGQWRDQIPPEAVQQLQEAIKGSH